MLPMSRPTGKRNRDWVELCVGGTARFSTTISTLSASSTYFSAKFSTEWAQDASELFLDRDAVPFEILLSCMRSRTVALLPQDEIMFKRVLLEAEYFGVDFVLDYVKAATFRNMNPTTPAGDASTSASGAEAAATADVAADASSAPMPAVSTTLSDSEAAAAFDAEHGGLEAALRAGVLPRRYFQRDMPPPSRPQGPTIRQLIPAGRTDTAFFNNDEDFQCRVVCYALVEQPTGATQVDAVIARGPEDDLDDGQQLQLASVYRREQQLATWAMRPVGEVTYTLEHVPPPVHAPGVHPASDGERRLLGVNEQAESGFVVRHVLPSPHETGACDVLMERTAPL